MITVVKIREKHCKTALSPSRLPGLDYSLNPYTGCQHGCVYCYVPNILRVTRSDWGQWVEVKTNIPTVLAKELKTKKPGVVGLSTVTDPYQPIEKDRRLTRYCLEQLVKADFPVCIQTKSSLIQRDVDIIQKLSNAEVMISIGTLNDSLRKIMEPHSSAIQQRIDTLHTCSNAGITTKVFFGPIYPDITKEDISTILSTFANAGVSQVMIDTLNKKPGIVPAIQKQSNVPCFKEWINYDPVWYNEIKHEIHHLGKHLNFSIVDAF